MTFALGPRAAQAGHRVRIYDRLDSTNSEAMRLASGGERGPLWIVALEQTLGRGRQGREWISGDGNLAVSLLLTLAVTPAVAATLGFVGSLAVAQMCRTLVPGIAVAQKWPNDVVSNDGKVAGLLLESEAQQGGLVLVVGIGVNLVAAPQGMAYPAAALSNGRNPIGVAAALSVLADSWIDYMAIWDGGRGFGEIRRLWLDQAGGIGQSVQVRMGSRVISGQFETLDQEGRLILRVTDGTRSVISAGDVFFGDGASVGAAS
ncbi:biotin--[acetyl-CoA-carboxylase] ligase [Pseudorhodoplanes sp.]|uniref:biotin--[acetyl-CoA-carboxylase] ligase n=1 Tax=Pseudorhodoplanes sp. TaxID=1934341 RepID=UPI003D0F5CC8